MMIPFSYHLHHIPTNLHYYGIKHSKGCQPSDLWKTYFSSSKIVKSLIKQYGKDSFSVEVRRIFTTSQEALAWEHRVLRRLHAAEKDAWINRHNGGTKFRSPQKHTEKTKEKISKKLKGRKISGHAKIIMREKGLIREQHKKETGWHMSEESRQKISSGVKKVAHLIYTDERNEKMANSKKGTKKVYQLDGSFKYLKP